MERGGLLCLYADKTRVKAVDVAARTEGNGVGAAAVLELLAVDKAGVLDAQGIAVLRAAVGDELLGGVVAEQLLYLSVDLIARDSGVDLGVFKPLVLAESHVVGKVIIGIG